ncbi:hypothetical protein [Labilibaculum filiforme]|nr:hypothetical protein [Labilibaculum filiforme]
MKKNNEPLTTKPLSSNNCPIGRGVDGSDGIIATLWGMVYFEEFLRKGIL